MHYQIKCAVTLAFMSLPFGTGPFYLNQELHRKNMLWHFCGEILLICYLVKPKKAFPAIMSSADYFLIAIAFN